MTTYFVSAGGNNSDQLSLATAARNFTELTAARTLTSPDIVEVDGDAGTLADETGAVTLEIVGTIRKYSGSTLKPIVNCTSFTGNRFFNIASDTSIKDIDFNMNVIKDAVYGFSISNVVVDSCFFNYSVDGGSGVDIGGAVSNITIKNCIFKGLSERSIDFSLDKDAANTGCYIINNTVYGVSEDVMGTFTGLGINIQDAGNITILNNIISFNGYGPEGIRILQTTGTFDYNLFYNISTNYIEGPGGEGANDPVNADPLFTSIVGNDFTLQAGSPAINAGTNTAADVDFAGISRPQDSIFDIGAHESISASSESPSESASESSSESASESASESGSESASESPSPSPGETTDSYTAGEELNGTFYGGSYTIPSGAFDVDVDFTFTRSNVDVDTPPRFMNLGLVIETEPADIQPNSGHPITLVFNYTDQDVIDSEIVNEHKMKVYRWDSSNEAWVKVSPSIVDVDANTVTATLRHLSTFGIGQEASVTSSDPLQIQTPANKIQRVSRKIHSDGITATKCLWVEFVGGQLQDITTGTPGKINKFPWDPGSNDQYESHDKRVGRITTIETDGARIIVNYLGYVTGMGIGDDLVVSVEAGQEGKLKKAADAASGTYEVVARCEEIDNIEEIMVFKTTSPRMITI